MFFGFKKNKLTKTFYYENMYYKIFYLIFNHIRLIKVFFKDKKIFYNFSKYFQTNLYIFLIKKNLMILNLFFHFFYILFLIHTKLIYKLFHYFKMLQYKFQSFIILYKPIFKFEKKIRLKFAKTNCIVYKNLNNKLIKFFSLYKSYLKKTSQPLSNLLFKFL